MGYSLTRPVIEKALDGLAESTDTEMIWPFLKKVDGMKMVALPDNHSYGFNVRLTLDYEEDYWLLSTIARILGNDVSRSEIKQLFLDNPDLKQINYFRNQQWKLEQNKKQNDPGVS